MSLPPLYVSRIDNTFRVRVVHPKHVTSVILVVSVQTLVTLLGMFLLDLLPFRRIANVTERYQSFINVQLPPEE